MSLLTKKVVAYWKDLPDNACITGTELCRHIGVPQNQLGGLVNSGQLPPTISVVTKPRFGDYKVCTKPRWKIGDLRQWVNTDSYITLRIKHKLRSMQKHEHICAVKVP